jgi:20S proteasome alpha/beta subunit
MDFCDKNLVPKRFCHSQWPKPKIKKSMSILIGIMCPEAIVLATDSQITNPYNGNFSIVNKIGVIRFLMDEILVAQAGLWPLTNRVVQIMRKKAKGLKITSAEVVTQIAEDSIREAKSRLDKEQKDFVNQHPTGLMLAFYVVKKPHLYTINAYGSGFVNEEEKHYDTMGIGSDLADFLLKEYAMPKSEANLAIATSIFAIKKVKDTNRFCGGDTTVKWIAPMFASNWETHYVGKTQNIDQKFVNLTEKRLVKSDDATKKSRNKRFYEILRKTGSELWQKHVEKVQAEQKARLDALPKNNP